MKLRSILTELVPINMQLSVARARFVSENIRQLPSGRMWDRPAATRMQQLRSLWAVSGAAASHIMLNTRT